MWRYYNDEKYSEISQYEFLLKLLKKSTKKDKKTMVVISDILDDKEKDKLDFLVNEKKFLHPSEEKDNFWNSYYIITQSWKRYISMVFNELHDHKFFLVSHWVLFFSVFFSIPIGLIVDQLILVVFNVSLQLSNYIITILFWWGFIYVFYLMKVNWKKRKEALKIFKKENNLA